MERKKSYDELTSAYEALRARLEDAEETLRAIRNHEVDALMAEGPGGDQVFTLQGAEQPYRVLVETMNEGAFTMTPDGAVLYCNNQFSELLRLPLNKIMGASLSDFLVSQDHEQSFEAMLRTCGIEGCKNEFRLKRADGHEVPVLLAGRSLMLNDVEAFCIVATDLTEQKRTEEALRESLAEIETYYNMAPVGLAVLDHEMRYVRINERLAQMNGAPSAAHIGQTPREIVPRLADQLERLARQVLESGEPVANIEFKGETPAQPGVQRTWLEGWYPLKNAAGEVIGITSVVQEVTEQRLLEEQLHQAQKMEAIGTLAGGIAHDFNNVLAAIIGFTEMVIDDVSDNPHAQQKMEHVLKAGLRGRDLVKQILAFTRKTEGERKEISLTPLVKETHELLRASLPSTIRMKLVISTGDDYVVADATQMQQVLMNLATNGADAMQKEGGQLTIELSSVTFPQGSPLPDPDMVPGAYVKLTVRDTGAGMSEDVRRRIFEPFFTTKGPGKGTGMGLAVVYGAVKGHGGTVTVHTEMSQGTTFEVFLPQAQRPEAKKDEATTPLPTGTERILFVDDEEMLVKMARSMLKSLGYQVTGAANGTDAWNQFLEDPWRFDLVITDQTMPDVTGVTLAQKMLKVRKEIPIILCTGHSDMVSAAKAKDIGIREFVMKPMVRKELAETVRRVLDGRKE